MLPSSSTSSHLSDCTNNNHSPTGELPPTQQDESALVSKNSSSRVYQMNDLLNNKEYIGSKSINVDYNGVTYCLDAEFTMQSFHHIMALLNHNNNFIGVAQSIKDLDTMIQPYMHQKDVVSDILQEIERMNKMDNPPEMTDEEIRKESLIRNVESSSPKEKEKMLEEINDNLEASLIDYDVEDLLVASYTPKKKKSAVIRPEFNEEIDSNLDLTIVDDLDEDISKVVTVMKLHKHINTRQFEAYSGIVYVSFWKEQIKGKTAWSKIQPKPFPIEKITYLRFLIFSRASGFSHKTMKGCFVYGLNKFIKRHPKFGESPVILFKEAIQQTTMGLIRLYGCEVYKVAPMMFSEVYKVTYAADLTKVEDLTDVAIMHVIRATGMRGDSLIWIRLEDVKFQKVEYYLNDDKWFVIHTSMEVKKDKRTTTSSRNVSIFGKQNHTLCSSFILLYYLWYTRSEIFANFNSNWEKFISDGKFTFKNDVVKEFLFFKKQSKSQCCSNGISEYIRNITKRILNVMYCARAGRSGIVVENMLVDIIRNHIVQEQTKSAISFMLGHVSKRSIKSYERYAFKIFNQLPERYLADTVHHRQMIFQYVQGSIQDYGFSSSDTLETTFHNILNVELSPSSYITSRKSNPNGCVPFKYLFMRDECIDESVGFMNIPQTNKNIISQRKSLPQTRVDFKCKTWLIDNIPKLKFLFGKTVALTETTNFMGSIYRSLMAFSDLEIVTEEDKKQFNKNYWKVKSRVITKFKILLNSYWNSSERDVFFEDLVSHVNRYLKDHHWFDGVTIPLNPEDLQKFFSEFKMTPEEYKKCSSFRSKKEKKGGTKRRWADMSDDSSADSSDLQDTQTDDIFVVDEILDHQLIEKDIDIDSDLLLPKYFNYLVKWQGYGYKQSTWEPFDNFVDESMVLRYFNDYIYPLDDYIDD
ncbi:predicted protein [Naegleria gruberi]|uniref:Predicted protein n=1 Tax=Naegleria gruberi TaxID=5762 RepID=D2VHF4_NAEGR|nr:uncharacterized protein NAEGRDRAFT_68309 [Naegleria gruberi]EFC43670.1 predicted protein [Naegleria gruberi]|eukprot:XP_002676414.1 predicted protein [Naegleria gruberi strain NEG-M]